MITINLDTNTESAEIISGEGNLKSEKIVSLQDLIQAFNVQSSYTSPILPGDSGLLQYKVEGDNEYYYLVTPPSIQDVEYSERDDDDEYVNVPYKTVQPYALWSFRFAVESSGMKRLVESSVYAMKHGMLSQDDVLYHMPASNVFDSSKICWGNLEGRIQVSNMRAIQSIPNRFYYAPFNTDLEFDRFSSRSSYNDSVSDRSERIKEGPKGYSKWCTRQLAAGKTMDEILDIAFNDLELRRVSRTIRQVLN